jgi:signal transduction histidine kinase
VLSSFTTSSSRLREVAGLGAPASRREVGWFVAVLTALTVLDAVIAWQVRAPQWVALGVVLAVAVVAAVLGPARRWAVLMLPVVSLLATGTGALVGWEGGQAGLPEMAALLWARAWQVLRGRGPLAVLVAGLDLAALLVLPLRVDDGAGRGDAVLVLVAAAAGVAAVCTARRRRSEARASLIEQARRQERDAIAVELHDVATHHLTAVVLQAQVAQRLAADDTRLPDALARVEHGAADALDALRSLVGVLHAGPAAGATLDPVGGLESIPDLVARWAADHVAVEVTMPTPSVEVPPVVGAAAVRVVREALTNVRKHAPATTRVTVEVTQRAGLLLVEVADCGPGSTTTAGRPGRTTHGGLGLVGLTERVGTLGGDLSAGPEGAGWAVRAAIPLDATAGQHR